MISPKVVGWITFFAMFVFAGLGLHYDETAPRVLSAIGAIMAGLFSLLVLIEYLYYRKG